MTEPTNEQIERAAKDVGWHFPADVIRAGARDIFSPSQTLECPILAHARTIAEAEAREDFQSRVDRWMAQTFSQEVRSDKIERAMRFLEEATELCQAIGLSREKASVVIDYVFGRSIGEPWQEVGGSMVTLAALCASIEQDMAACGERELARIDTPEMREKIAAKQVSKRLFGMVGESVEALTALQENPDG